MMNIGAINSIPIRVSYDTSQESASMSDQQQAKSNVINHLGLSSSSHQANTDHDAFNLFKSITSTQIDQAHDLLKDKGYELVGYHAGPALRTLTEMNEGFTQTDAQNTEAGPDEWKGLWCSTDTNVCKGYLTTEVDGKFSCGVLTRVYLPIQDANNADFNCHVVDNMASDEAQKTAENSLKNESKYIITGKQNNTEDLQSNEMVINPKLRDDCIMIPSKEQPTGYNKLGFPKTDDSLELLMSGAENNSLLFPIENLDR